MRSSFSHPVVRPLTKVAGVIATMSLALTALIATAPAAHAQLGFSLGIDSNGGLDLFNTSASPGFTLNGFTITFSAPNQTFFDTTDTPPGEISQGFSVFSNNGITTISLPGDVATDGQQTATFNFTGFDGGDSVGFDFDLDAFDNIDSNGDVRGGLVSALFSNGQTVSGTIVSGTFTPIRDTFGFGVTASAAVAGAPNPVPEPGTVVVGLSLLGMTGLGMVRGRMRPRQAPKNA